MAAIKRRVLLKDHDSITYNTKQSEQYDHSKGEEGYERIGMEIRVSVLEDLHQQKSSNDEHEGSVWCKVC